MRLFVDLDTLAVSDFRNSAVSSLTAKRSDRFPVQVRFQSGGVVQELPHGTTGRIVLKKTSDYSGYPVAWSPGWRKVGYGSSAYYVFQLNLHTQQVLDQFLTLGGELERVGFVFEIQWEHRGNRRSSRAIPVVVENDYVRLNDTIDPPTPIEEPPGPPIHVPEPQDYKATKLQAEQGEDNESWMTPLRTAQAIATHDHGNISNAGAIGTASGVPIITGANGVLQAGAFGTTAGTYAAGNHTHDWASLAGKPASFPAEAHDHGNITSAGAIGTASGAPIITGANGVLQAGAFGTTAGTYAAGNHAHDWASLADKPASFPAEAHAHGNITSAGAIGTASGVPIITGANGVLQAGAFGTTAGTYAAGDHAHAGMLTATGGIAAIAVVAELPASPNSTTLYIVTG